MIRVDGLPARLDEPDEPDPLEDAKKATPGGVVNELESRLFKGRKVMVFGQINDRLARDVVARIRPWPRKARARCRSISIRRGGHVESGDTIHDIIKFVRTRAPIDMIGTGWVASAGALIYSAAEKTRRYCLPNTRFLLHQPMGGVRGPATDIDIEAREIIKMRERLSEIIAAETGQTLERVRRDTDRNYWMSATEAIEYGLAHKVIASIDDLK